MKNKKKKFIFLLIIFISIGFSYLSTNLYINGTSLVKGTSWSVYFANIDNENSTYQINNNATISSDKKSVEFEVTFEKPTDEYSFYVDVVNNGNLDAMLDTYEITGLTTDQSKYLEWQVTYADKTSLSKYDLLRKNSYDTFFIKVNFIEDVDYSDLPQDSDVTVNLRFKVVYVQADSNFQVSRNRTQYTITYNLDGGVIENNPTTYYQGDRVVIPNPTKEGYTFTGWTIGKNFICNVLDSYTQFGITIIKNSDESLTINGNATKGFEYRMMNSTTLKPGTYIHHANILRNGAFFSFNNVGNTMINGSNGENNKVFTLAEETTYPRYFFWIDQGYSFVNDRFYVQLEEGNVYTDYEPCIVNPTKNIVLSKGSNGNRTYKANWIAN